MNNFNFDVLKYLNNKNVKFKTSGKNIGNYLGIEECVFCGAGGFHLGVSLDGRVSCWHCGRHSLKELLFKIEKNYKKVNQALEQFKLEPEEILKNLEQDEPIVRNTDYKLPSGFTRKIPDAAKEYLELRGFSHLELQKNYDLMWAGEYGREKYRLAFPVYEEGKIVNFIARTVLENKDIMPYMFDLDSNAAVPRNELLFGIDNCFGDKAILVEGVFDAVNIGTNCIAILSINFSRKQILKLKQKGLKKFYMMPDNESKAIKRFKELEGYLTWAEEINWINYQSADPGCMNKKDVNELRRMIF